MHAAHKPENKRKKEYYYLVYSSSLLLALKTFENSQSKKERESWKVRKIFPKKKRSQKENKQREIVLRNALSLPRIDPLNPFGQAATDNFKIPLTPFSSAQLFVNTSGGGQITSTHPLQVTKSRIGEGGVEGRVVVGEGGGRREWTTFRRRRRRRRRPLIPVYNRLLTVGEINTVINNIRWPEPRKKRPLLAGRQAQKPGQLSYPGISGALRHVQTVLRPRVNHPSLETASASNEFECPPPSRQSP